MLRRIDALEKSLNTRLFHRHARGSVPTAADYAVRAGITLQNTLYASEDYIRECGPFKGLEQVAGHCATAVLER